MANGKPWTEKEKTIVIKMRSEKRSYQEIAEVLGRTAKSLNSFINRCNVDEDIIPRRKNNTSCLLEYEKRRKCHALGMTDREAAEECNMSYGTYSCWRIKAKLPCNPERKVLEKVLVKTEVKPARTLKQEDIANYKHNAKVEPVNNISGEVKIFKNDEIVKKAFEKVKPKAKLSESPIFVIGSKWTEPDSYITAPKNCKDRMRNNG